MPQKSFVYVLEHKNNENVEILGVFTDEDKARKAFKNILIEHKFWDNKVAFTDEDDETDKNAIDDNGNDFNKVLDIMFVHTEWDDGSEDVFVEKVLFNCLVNLYNI